jgi:hypothetical protein
MVYDLSRLSNIRELYIHRCNDVTSCKGLSGVQFLDLSSCSGLHDIADLASIPCLRSVSVSWCFEVTDISALKNIHSVFVEACNVKKAAQQLGGERQREVSLSELSLGSDFSPFSRLEALSIYN